VRVASKYRYEGVDSIQLNKHTSAAAMLIAEDILMDNKDARLWSHPANAVALCTWLVAFLDSLLFWEEQSGKQFVEIFSPSHKFSIGKLFQLLAVDVRKEAIAKLVFDTTEEDGCDDSEDLPCFRQPRSKRMRRSGLLIQALQKPKVAIREMELGIPEEPSDTTDGRRSKRCRR
jgi:hypothetical protein